MWIGSEHDGGGGGGGGERVSVTFSCQRCLQPLRLCAELGSLGEHALAELRLPASTGPPASLVGDASTLEPGRSGGCDGASHRVAACADDLGDFALVSDADDGRGPGAGHGLGRRFAREASLFDALSDNSDVDHPLCDECADSLLRLMDERLARAEAERRDYAEHLERLERDARDDRAPDADALAAELDERRAEERRLLDELEALRAEEGALAAEIDERDAERRRLLDEQGTYLREHARRRRELARAEDRARCHEARLAHAQAQLERLKKADALRAAFRVSDSGRFGAINDFRLGRLPDAPVDWSEINAAWGQTALLLASLARRVGLEFERHEVVPYGNRSFVRSLADGRELPLHGAGGFKLLWDAKFDAAMVAFVDCVAQFKERVERAQPDFALPYVADRGKIEDPAANQAYSVKIQFNSEEQWTKALKHLLTNLKWGLAWVCSRGPTPI